MGLTNDDFERIMLCAAEANVADVHITEEVPVYWRRYGALSPLREYVPSQQDMRRLLNRLLDDDCAEHFRKKLNADFSWNMGKWRYRFNISRLYDGRLSFAIRTLARQIPELSELGQAGLLRRFLKLRQGLLLITGKTSNGKTTSAAAFINELNNIDDLHIITLEDPVEFIFPPGRCLISQRELGKSFYSYAAAIKNAMRQDPDIIYISELRDTETVRLAIDAAATGHLVVATMHTAGAVEALERLEGMFSADERAAGRSMLSSVLKGVCTQQLFPVKSGGLGCAVEILTANQSVRSLIRAGKFEQLTSVMQSGGKQGMQTMQQGIAQLSLAEGFQVE